MGALTLGVGKSGAYISDNMVINNGGYASFLNIPLVNVSHSAVTPFLDPP